MKKIYCAGPLFNPKEREDMEDIANKLEDNGYKVFLPHRDGIELAKVNNELVENGYSLNEANFLLAKAIFHIDIFQISKNDGLVLNLNGRVPDEGAMVEAGIAWALGKPLVIYKNDSRSLLQGLDNPLVLGLSMFKVISDTEKIPIEFDYLFANGYKNSNTKELSSYNNNFEDGEKLFEAYADFFYNNIKINKFIDVLLNCKGGKHNGKIE